MRNLSAPLITAQQAATRTPYIYQLFTSKDGNTTYDYTARELSIIENILPYEGEAVITLRNNDLGVVDIRGFWIEIGWGDVTSGGNEYIGDGTNEPGPARLWVKKQERLDSPEGLFSILYLRGVWEYLEEHEVTVAGVAPDFAGNYASDTTVYDISDAVLIEAGFSLDALGTNDGIMGTYQPNFYLNDDFIENARDVLFRLASMTKSYFRPKAGLAFEVVYPQEGDSVDETYYSDQVFWFYKYNESLNELIPNHILVYCNEGDDDWANLIIGEASDATAIARYKDVTRRYKAAYITNQTDATNRAIALLAKAQTEVFGAFLVIPMDHSVQLYDKALTYSSRGT